MTNNDTAFAGESQTASTFDPIYDTYQNAPLQDAQDTEDALPRGIYLVEFEGGKGGFTKDENLPQMRVGATVVLGVDGTVGRKAFGSLKFGTSQFGYENNEQGVRVKVKLSDAKWRAEGLEDASDLKRVATVLQLLQPLPNRPHTVESLTQFGGQFAKKRAVIEIGQSAGRDEYGPSNFFLWKSIRAVDEIVRTKQGEIVGTATEYATKKIAAANLRAAKKAGKGTAVAASGAPAATAQDFS